MFRNDVTEMTTTQYAKYISEIIGKKKSPESVANDCRNGKLECYRESEKGEWRIIVKRTFVPISEYDELYKKYKEAITTIAGIKKLII